MSTFDIYPLLRCRIGFVLDPIYPSLLFLVLPPAFGLASAPPYSHSDHRISTLLTLARTALVRSKTTEFDEEGAPHQRMVWRAPNVDNGRLTIE
jgi:hypothetical protein